MEETYLPGRGQWAIHKTHGLVWRPPLHFGVRPTKVGPSGRACVIICVSGRLRSRGPYPI